MSLQSMNDDHMIDKSFPWWVKAISLVGLPSLIAAYLVFNITQIQNERLILIEHAIQEQIKARQYSERINMQFLQRICVNTATDISERNQCWTIY